jgi:hypothetical protein
MSFATLIEQMMCQECFIRIQGDYKDFQQSVYACQGEPQLLRGIEVCG